MRKGIVLFFLLSIISITAQERAKSLFEFGVLGGVNFNNIEKPGGSFFIEGRYTLSSNLKLKLSLGYNNLFEGKDLPVKTYIKTNIAGGDKYQVLNYTLEKFNYEIIPISAGIEYLFGEGSNTLYCTAEFGYNSFSAEAVTGLKYYGAGGTFNSLEELPAENRSLPPGYYKGDSYRIAVGGGYRFVIASFLTGDIRYAFQVNTSLVNSHLFLIGISI